MFIPISINSRTHVTLIGALLKLIFYPTQCFKLDLVQTCSNKLVCIHFGAKQNWNACIVFHNYSFFMNFLKIPHIYVIGTCSVYTCLSVPLLQKYYIYTHTHICIKITIYLHIWESKYLIRHSFLLCDRLSLVSSYSYASINLITLLTEIQLNVPSNRSMTKLLVNYFVEE